MQPLQGKNWFFLAAQPQGGAPLTPGYYMQPLGAKIRTTGTHLPEDPIILGSSFHTEDDRNDCDRSIRYSSVRLSANF